MESAVNGFHAARQRYKKRRTSRASASSADGRQWRIVSKITRRELALNDQQCEQLAEAYTAIPDKYHAFEQMFLQLMKDDTQIASVFGFTGIKSEEVKLLLRRLSPFRTHVCKFLRFITTILDMLPKKGREEELIQILRMVGHMHTNVKQLSFTASKWLSFKSAMLTTLARNEQDKNCWNILISFMIFELKEAYLAHIRTLRSNSLPHVLESYRLEIRKELNPPVNDDKEDSKSTL
ncbi:GLOBIN domain-containing protein [Aphelenchoides besseyi]|nr:GLOBIN domain-containing protein [Aphelenchoides besseyi]KAI6236722.1 GLOBIN domain-containing protein [Aphelenchoides besseyi]